MNLSGVESVIGFLCVHVKPSGHLVDIKLTCLREEIISLVYFVRHQLLLVLPPAASLSLLWFYWGNALEINMTKVAVETL